MSLASAYRPRDVDILKTLLLVSVIYEGERNSKQNYYGSLFHTRILIQLNLNLVTEQG